MQAPKDAREGVYVHDDFKPNDPRLARLYQESDVLVVPTTADTGPLWVFMEAMAMRLPVIGTDTGANKELVQHGKTGLDRQDRRRRGARRRDRGAARRR